MGEPRTILIIVPHPDDELLIAGGVLYNSSRSVGSRAYVYIATNGDSLLGQAYIRCSESVKALKKLGIPQDHIIFGGFGNEWRGTHIYHLRDDEVGISKIGKRETYQAIRRESSGAPNNTPYTRYAYKRAVFDIIRWLVPDTIIYIGLDDHPDHRALSLITEECLASFLREHDNYRPLILSKFAYDGVLNGARDYYDKPLPQTLVSGDLPFYNESSCLRFSVREECKTPLLAKNILFKAAKAYRSQRLREHAEQFLNSDIVYWLRRSDNVALNAKIDVSSGDAAFLNDFKLLEMENVLDARPAFRGWKPNPNDIAPTIFLSWDKPVKVACIKFYVLALQNAVQSKLVFRKSDSATIDISTTFKKSDEISTVCLENPFDIVEIEIHFYGSICLGEIEVLPVEEIPIDDSLFMTENTRYANNVKKRPFIALASRTWNKIWGTKDRAINIIRRQFHKKD